MGRAVCCSVNQPTLLFYRVVPVDGHFAGPGEHVQEFKALSAFPAETGERSLWEAAFAAARSV